MWEQPPSAVPRAQRVLVFAGSTGKVFAGEGARATLRQQHHGRQIHRRAVGDKEEQ